MSLAPWRLLVLNVILGLTLVGCYWGYRTAQVDLKTGDFLNERPVMFQNWSVTTQEITARDREVLAPDSVLIRSFVGAGPKKEQVSLVVVAGHRKQTVHTPAYCLMGGGWEIVTSEDGTLVLEGIKLDVVRAFLSNGTEESMTLYFFTDGTFATRNLLAYQRHQFFRRLRGELPMGALVRISVPVMRDRARAQELGDAFSRAVLPDILQRLKDAQKG